MTADARAVARFAREAAGFAHRTRLADVPAHVVGGARLLLLDTLGALVGGLQYPPVQALAASVRAPEPAGPTDAPFGRLLVLGTASTWLDADSGGSFHPQGHRLPPVPTAHPAPHCLPVLLHAAAAGDVGDERLLEVFLVACEVGLRLGVGTTLRPGLHPHGIHGPASSAVAASLVQGLDVEETADAVLLGASLPLAATLAVPVRGGTVRNVWTGLGAHLGAQAAGRARDGVRGSADVVTQLFDEAVCTGLDVEELSGGLGRRWRVVDSYLKPYACARWIHPALDALAQVLAGTSRPASAIERVDVDTFAFAASLAGGEPVTGDLHARFSLPTCLAALALDGELVASTFLPGALARPEVADLAARVHVTENPDFSGALPRERPATVRVRWRDGTERAATVRTARGNPDSPLSRAEVEHKFRRNVAGVLDDPVAAATVASLLDGEPPRARAVAAVARHLVTAWCP